MTATIDIRLRIENVKDRFTPEVVRLVLESLLTDGVAFVYLPPTRTEALVLETSRVSWEEGKGNGPRRYWQTVAGKEIPFAENEILHFLLESNFSGPKLNR